MRWEVVDDGLDYDTFRELAYPDYRGLWHITYNEDGPARSYLVSIRNARQRIWTSTHISMVHLSFDGTIRMLYRGVVVQPTPIRRNTGDPWISHNYLTISPDALYCRISHDPEEKIDSVPYWEPGPSFSPQTRWRELRNRRFPCPECEHYWPDFSTLLPPDVTRSAEYPDVMPLDCCRKAHGTFELCASQRTFTPCLVLGTCGARGRYFEDHRGSRPTIWYEKLSEWLYRKFLRYLSLILL
jgi:hypothetical protein